MKSSVLNVHFNAGSSVHDLMAGGIPFTDMCGRDGESLATDRGKQEYLYLIIYCVPNVLVILCRCRCRLMAEC